MEKRGKLIVLLLAGFLFLVLVPLVKSEKQCPTKAGDANGDGNVDISDASAILRYLFTPGSIEPCRNNADADGNGILSITDAIRILNYLFRGGAPPESADKPLELGYINYGSDVNGLDIIAPLEVTVPGKIDILDTAFEDPPIYNIKKCEAYKEEDGDVPFYSATWEDKDIVNIKNQPLVIPIELTEFLTDAEYKIKVKCWEQDGDSGEVFLEIKTKPQIVFNPDNFPRVECSQTDRCCRRSDESYYCSVDIGRGAPACDASDIEVSQNDCCYPYQAGPDGCLVDNRIWQLANSKQNSLKYIPLEEQTTAHQCSVEKMTIITKGGSLVFGGENNDEPPLPIEEPIQGTPSFNGNGLGHFEGWYQLIVRNDMMEPNYMAGFRFYVFAWLSQGSQPDKCAEHQFIKHTTVKTNGESTTILTPSSMHEYVSLLLNSLSLMPELMKLEDVFRHQRVDYPEISEVGCNFWGNEFCDDNAGEPYSEKIHLPGTLNRRPVILWYDSPGRIATYELIKGAKPPRPWESETGEELLTKSVDNYFIMIIEGTDGKRWVCELELHFQNLGAQATSTKKFDIQEKFCECKKQEFNGFWGYTGDINPCNTT